MKGSLSDEASTILRQSSMVVCVEKKYIYWYINIMPIDLRPVVWMGSSRSDLRSFPPQVRSDIGKALYAAQQGDTDPAAKSLRGFGGTRVMEIVDRHDTNTYRAVYTAQFADMLYVLHVFQKKSKQGKQTPRRDIELIRRRLADAERHHRERQN